MPVYTGIKMPVYTDIVFIQVESALKALVILAKQNNRIMIWRKLCQGISLFQSAWLFYIHQP